MSRYVVKRGKNFPAPNGAKKDLGSVVVYDRMHGQDVKYDTFTNWTGRVAATVKAKAEAERLEMEHKGLSKWL